MPLHDVKCSKCGHIQESFWLPTEKPEKISCNNCQSLRTKVLPGRARISFGGVQAERELESEAAEMGW